MGDNPATSVTDGDGRFHHVDNAYALGPAAVPLRRLARTRCSPPPPSPDAWPTGSPRRPAFTPDPGFHALFDGSNTAKWRMSTITNQPGRDDPDGS